MTLRAIALLLLLCAFPAFAAEKPGQHVTLAYKAYWGGLPAGDIVLTTQQDKNSYHDSFLLSSKGLIKSLLRLQVTAESDGVLNTSTPQTRVYQSSTKNRGKEKKYSWNYDPKTKLARTPSNPGEEQRVTENFRLNVTDPLAALSQIRAEVRASRANLASLNGKIIPVYDGRRRYDLTLNHAEPQAEKIGKKQIKALGIDVGLTPIAGFKESDKDMWSKISARLVMADDGLYMPVRIVVETPLAPAVILLKGGCVGEPPCGGNTGL